MMKRKTGILIIISLILFLFQSCSSDIPLNIQYDKIASYSSYTAIAVGNSSTTRDSNVRNTDTDENKLLGRVNEDTFEELSFIDINGNSVSQELFITSYKAFTNWIFVGYSDKPGQINWDFNSISPDDHYYILHIPTGKMYYLNQVFTSFNIYTMRTFDENDSSFFLLGTPTGTDSTQMVYEIYLAESSEELIIRQRVNTELLPTFSNFIVDKFGNIYPFWKTVRERDYRYVVKNNNTISSLSGSYFIGMNKIVYSKEDDTAFNSSGERVDVSYKPATEFYVGCNDPSYHPNKYLIYQEDLSYFYYLAISSVGMAGYEDRERIYKVTYETEEKIQYTVEEIVLEDYYDGYNYQFVINNDRLLILKDDQIFYINIKNGRKTIVSDDYIYRELRSDALGNIIFTAVDDGMNTVKGTIDYYGIVDINVIPNELNIIDLKPIN